VKLINHTDLSWDVFAGDKRIKRLEDTGCETVTLEEAFQDDYELDFWGNRYNIFFEKGEIKRGYIYCSMRDLANQWPNFLRDCQAAFNTYTDNQYLAYTSYDG
jgi:hypothetical protein